MISVSKHYDLLIENGNDPVLDGKELSEYMNKWDGKEFINLLDEVKEIEFAHIISCIKN